MFCKHCGKESVGSQKFCTSCGAEFLDTLETIASQQSTVSSTPKSSSKLDKIIPAIILLALLGWGVYRSLDEDVIEANNSAISDFDSGNNEQAVLQFQQASRDAVTNDTRISTLKNLAYVYSSEGQMDLAINSFNEALALTVQDSFDYYLIAGEIASLEGKPNAAQISYSKAYEKDPNDFQINNALTVFYMDIENTAPQYVDYKKALHYAQRAAQLSDLQIVKQNLGIAYYYNENYPQAISVLSDLTLDRGSYTAYFLGLSYLQNGDSVNAKIYLQKAIDSGEFEVPQEIYDYIESN